MKILNGRHTPLQNRATRAGEPGFNISLGTIPNYADSTDGLLLDGVRDGSPAAKAGLKAGDKVIKLAGRDIRKRLRLHRTPWAR